jgi:hypothetical protein
LFAEQYREVLELTVAVLGELDLGRLLETVKLLHHLGTHLETMVGAGR